MADRVRPKRILVIGGGPSGLVTLKNLLDLGKDAFERVELVERRDDVGGVWYLDPFEIPPEQSQKPRWPSPSYPGLVGNVLPEFLSFRDTPFPEPPNTPQQPFPTLKETYQYLRNFAEPYITSGNIRLGHEVTSVEELPDLAGWKVKFKDWSNGWNGVERDEIWDAVVIAVGWYDNPLWPETEGLEMLKEKGLALHAKSWRGPVGCEGKRMLVIGNANSANDVAAHLAAVAQIPVYRSIRRPAFFIFTSLLDERIEDVTPVRKYILAPSGDTFDVELENGTMIQNLNRVIVGTGYRPYPSFIHVLSTAESTKSTLEPLMSENINPHRIPSLHRHILYAPNPTLGFSGSTFCFTPFTVNDVGSAWLALAWTGEIPYPPTLDGRLAFEAQRLRDIDEGRKETAEALEKEGLHDNRALPSSFMQYTVLLSAEEGYAGSLREDVVKARPELGKSVEEGGYPIWSDESRVHRESMYPTKFEALKWARENHVKGGTEI
ncbi:FAD/NAD(P)-binding domain-containing protein [Marasmius fiardii PR-910]|nr:FAD/NAD(P)-binding domain-containing protein [Marasmius fiardii PR-910]